MASAANPVDLDALFAPRSIAVVGASADARKFGNRIVRILQRHAFAGPVFPVNASESVIEGLPAYASLAALPEAADLAIVCVPAAAVPEAAQQACVAGTKALVVYSSGFREAGAQGRALEAQLVRIADEHGAVLLGPNCQGPANFHNGAVANFSLAMLDPMGTPGGLAIVGQSGLLGTALTDSMKGQAGITPGVLVATGNEAQVTALAIAEYLARARPEIDTILVHTESVPSFADLARAAAAAAANGKELCVLKVGRTKAGQKAAASHTGSMPVDDAVFTSACDRLGIRLVTSIESAVRTCRVLLQAPRERAGGRRVGIVSNSGGVGALFADLLTRADLAVAELAAATRRALAADLPGQDASGFNPADANVLPYSALPKYFGVLRAMAHDPGVDQVLVFLGMQRSNVPEIAQGLADVQRASGKPVVACAMGCAPELVAQLTANGVLALDDSTAAVDTLAALAVPRQASRAPSVVRATPVASVGTDAATWHAPWSDVHNRLFAEAGVAVLPTYFETDVAAAVARAAQTGYPVALKVFSRRHTHKSDIGGVRLNVTGSDEVRSWCNDMRARLATDLEGYLVQKMCPFAPVAEAFVGCKRDPAFGDVILLGSGGVFVNEWADARVVADPDDPACIERAVDTLVMRPAFRPLRGRPGADVAALAIQIARIAALFRALPAEVAVLEFNPVILGRPGEGAIVADWRAEIVPRKELSQ